MDPQEATSLVGREGTPPSPQKNDDSKASSETCNPLENQHTPGGTTEPSKKVKKNRSVKQHHSRAKESRKQAPTSHSSSDSSSDDTEDSSATSDSETTDSESDSDADSHHLASQSLQKRRTHAHPKQKKILRAQGSNTSDSEPDISDSSVSKNSRSRKSHRAWKQQQEIARQLQLLLQQAPNPYKCPMNPMPPPSQCPPNPIPPPVIHNKPPPPVYDHPNQPRIPPSRHPGGHPPPGRCMPPGGYDPNISVDDRQQWRNQTKTGRKASKLDYKRVDEVWDNTLHNYKLQDTVQHNIDEQYDEYLFHVRRTFDWQGKFKATIVDIKSKLLRECLQEVMSDITGLSLVEETPRLNPNTLFLYIGELREHLKTLKRARSAKGSKHERKKAEKRINSKRKQLKVLVKYIDTDYADVKKRLFPMLENGLITFDLLWALWKPNTLAYTTTYYGSPDEPRVFKVELSEKRTSMLAGDFYHVEGKYFEYDGKQFGYGIMAEEIDEFQGARKITSLPCYPLQYHKDEAKVREELIERGKKFVSLAGVHYKSYEGMAFYKRKKAAVKVNVSGRIMVDALIHRRVNPNYSTSLVRHRSRGMLSEASDSDGSDGSDGSDSCGSIFEDELDKIKFEATAVQGAKDESHLFRAPKAAGDEESYEEKERLDKVHSKVNGAKEEEADKSQTTDKKQPPELTDEDYLIASPVVLGFAFADKLWLEFAVSEVKEVQWNEDAYESLVLDPKTKDIVKALVESHKYHAAESIDDVIVGKGKGLVAVLHGPPGTGKTLTAESVSELLRCPLYIASAGELGTNSKFLEVDLQKIRDICHAWGAILLLEEADVFLETRQLYDLHRNSLVSVFLRQLEYFQGILFMTTNRVETFDAAFQSRIHVALRYNILDQRAKKAIFKIFIERVRVLEKTEAMPFTEEHLDRLARHELNGRQIKNTVRTAHALAINKGEPLSMVHMQQVLDVQLSFDRDLKWGTGFEDAMRSYG